ncbi:hypothetical protein DL93DRAFT_2077938 [Clavulina sp. PMI_390]|nr:hypothetical protein DL93DRAFT_2077938 [Clavulina sp. PMI_390]
MRVLPTWLLARESLGDEEKRKRRREKAGNPICCFVGNFAFGIAEELELPREPANNDRDGDVECSAKPCGTVWPSLTR